MIKLENNQNRKSEGVEKMRKKNTPGTAGGPGGRDRTPSVKSRKIARKTVFLF